ncbi:MAG TPA: hypothetical protein VG755_31090, partial [Nannocystaceae bacterium]|nr:hypothetical protein [Nannocystaceae bacterium]
MSPGPRVCTSAREGRGELAREIVLQLVGTHAVARFRRRHRVHRSHALLAQDLRIVTQLRHDDAELVATLDQAREPIVALARYLALARTLPSIVETERVASERVVERSSSSLVEIAACDCVRDHGAIAIVPGARQRRSLGAGIRDGRVPPLDRRGADRRQGADRQQRDRRRHERPAGRVEPSHELA